KVMDLREVLQAFLDHRQDILCRSSRYRLAKIENRLEILKGFLTVYLNLDEVIRIIRYEDEPKTIMMEKWSLSDLQAEAILNMRLRSLKKLEEIEIRKEHDDLIKRGDELKALLADESLQKKAMRTEIRGVKKDFGQGTPIGKRRTVMGEPPKDLDIPIEAFVEKEPVTVVCSKMGWIRAIKGHLSPAEVQNIKYKDGDKTRFVLPAQTTDKLLVYGSNGRFYTLSIDKLPGGRGHGEPIRLMIEIEKDDDVVSMLLSTPKEQNREFLLASSDGRGFIVPESELLSNKKAGKQVLTLGGKSKAHVCAIVQGDHIAVVGSNRRLLIFKLDELPKMARGRGVILQKYHGAELSDAITFNPETGLKWKLGDRERTETDLRIWISKRATTGRLPPTGFPKGNKFS
ncbi:MAG: DNA topoisomerase IV subunit A, partial [Alphaproteobacteria bacterium]|nr:DNA topoisomerase IV subunit A [Alphaproteobacteria bacterium]